MSTTIFFKGRINFITDGDTSCHIKTVSDEV